MHPAAAALELDQENLQEAPGKVPGTIVRPLMTEGTRLGQMHHEMNFGGSPG